MKKSAPLAVVLDEAAEESAATGSQPWHRCCTEVLDHLRLPYEAVAAERLAGVGDGRVLLFPSAPGLDQEALATVLDWIGAGGVALCVGPGSLGPALGVLSGGEVADGHVVVEGGDDWIDPPDVALRALGGVRLAVTAPTGTITVLARWRDDGAPAVLVRSFGAGYLVVLGADLWQTIVRIQQGDPVHADGVAAADGTADVDDGVLKCDDGIVLSYESDRALPPHPGQSRPEGRAGLEPVPIFHRPHADLWRQVFFQLLTASADHCGAVLPWLHYWPSGVPAVGHLSVDSDRNVSEEAETALDLFDAIDVKTTWCHVYPGGYRAAVVQAIGDQGHEHALHFNAMDDADIARWGWAQLRAQYAWAQAMTGHEGVVSNKNHYTRWEGWDEFYLWCERLGIRLDESRGPSKRGNVGFPFGTAHLSFPVASAPRGGRRIDVLMLPLHAQDLAWTTHESVRDLILDQVVAHHGVAHFLFHPVHLHRTQYVRDACRDLVAEMRRRGLPIWTAGRLNEWERLRRRVTLSVRRPADGVISVVASAERPVPDAAILLALPRQLERSLTTAVDGTGATVRHSMVERHGRRMLELTVDLPEGETTVTVSHGQPAREPEAVGGRVR